MHQARHFAVNVLPGHSN